MRFAIKAYENTYDGLHGIQDMFVVTCNSEDEANECGRDASYGVIESYGLDDEYYEAAEEEGLEPETEEFEEYVQACREEAVAFETYKIIKETDESDVELSNKYYYDEEAFLKEYCGWH